MDRIRIKDLIRETGLSRATIDRAINGRGGVHVETAEVIQSAIGRLRLTQAEPEQGVDTRPRADLLIRLGRGLTDQFRACLPTLDADLALHDMHQRSEFDILSLVRTLCEDVSTPLIIAAKNDESLCAELARARQRGKRVVTVVSDLRHSARAAFVGIDNKLAGQTAAHLIGGLVSGAPQPKVAVVLGDYSFRCHEDREIGFRSQLRAAYPQIEITEAAKGEDSPEQTFAAVGKLLERHPDLSAIYNVAGGNSGLAKALKSHGRTNNLVYVTHEANHITSPLLRSGVINFVLAQNPAEMLIRATEIAIAADTPGSSRFIDFGIYSPFNIPTFGDSEAN